MKRKRYFIAPLFSFLLGLSLFAAGTLPLSELSADRYMQHVSFLASDDLKGRGNGSPELERAAEYIATQFRSFGLQTAAITARTFRSSTSPLVRSSDRKTLSRFPEFPKRRVKTSSHCRSRRLAAMTAQLYLPVTA